MINVISKNEIKILFKIYYFKGNKSTKDLSFKFITGLNHDNTKSKILPVCVISFTKCPQDEYDITLAFNKDIRKM